MHKNPIIHPTPPLPCPLSLSLSLSLSHTHTHTHTYTHSHTHTHTPCHLTRLRHLEGTYKVTTYKFQSESSVITFLCKFIYNFILVCKFLPHSKSYYYFIYKHLLSGELCIQLLDKALRLVSASQAAVNNSLQIVYIKICGPNALRYLPRAISRLCMIHTFTLQPRGQNYVSTPSSWQT